MTSQSGLRDCNNTEATTCNNTNLSSAQDHFVMNEGVSTNVRLAYQTDTWPSHEAAA